MKAIKQELEEVKQEVAGIQQDSWAMAILQDYKKQTKRQFVIILVLIISWFVTIGAFAYYINTTGYEVVTESAEVDNESGNANACVGNNCNNGVINGESKSNKNH